MNKQEYTGHLWDEEVKMLIETILPIYQMQKNHSVCKKLYRIAVVLGDENFSPFIGFKISKKNKSHFEPLIPQNDIMQWALNEIEEIDQDSLNHVPYYDVSFVLLNRLIEYITPEEINVLESLDDASKIEADLKWVLHCGLRRAFNFNGHLITYFITIVLIVTAHYKIKNIVGIKVKISLIGCFFADAYPFSP